MQLMRRGLLLILTFALLAAVPPSAAAQDWGQPWSDPRDRPPRVDVSITAGGLLPTDWSDLVVLGSLSSASGALEQVIVRDLRVEPDAVYGAAVTYWTDRVGLRVEGGLSRSQLTMGGPLDDPGAPRQIVAAGVDTWFYDARGTISLLPYTPDRRVLPYVFIGLGGITYDLSMPVSPPLLTFTPNPALRGTGAGNVVITEDDGRQFIVSVDELATETVFALSFGVGSDFRLPLGGRGIGVRVEVSDHLSESPLTVRITGMNQGGAFTSDSPVHFGAVHNLRAAAGIVFQIGR